MEFHSNKNELAVEMDRGSAFACSAGAVICNIVEQTKTISRTFCRLNSMCLGISRKSIMHIGSDIAELRGGSQSKFVKRPRAEVIATE